MQATLEPPSEDLDILDLLDAQLSAVSSKAGLEAKAKSAKHKLMSNQLSASKRTEARQELSDLQAQIEATRWAVVSNVALFSETTCRHCGTSHTVFLQFMERLKTTAGAKVNRLARIPHTHLGVPNEVLIHASEVEMCEECCGGQGFDMLSASITYVNQPPAPRSF